MGKGRSRRLKQLLTAALIISITLVLYFLLRHSLPKYAGRVPFLLVLFAIDYLLYRSLLPSWQNLRSVVRVVFALLWWMPIVVLTLFLASTALVPMQEMGSFFRIFFPGFALMAFIAKFIMLIPLLPAFLIRFADFFSNLFGRRLPSSVKRTFITFKKMGIFFGSLAFAGLLVGSTIWVYKFKTHRISISIQNLPDSLEGLRIVQLSDIHLGSWLNVSPLRKAVEQVNALKPDIIVFTGDMVNYSTAEVRGFESTLAGLKAPLGIYAILGNHDYGDYVSWNTDEEKEKNLQQLVAFYNSMGWILLRNETSVIERNGGSILLAGVENWSATARFRKYGDLHQTMKGAGLKDVNILLSHDPTHWEAEVSERFPEFDLTLSGHTHGMQMGIEAFGLKWSPASYIYKNWAGLTEKENPDGSKNYLYVNRGLGHIAYPGRVGILPEITLITLRK